MSDIKKYDPVEIPPYVLNQLSVTETSIVSISLPTDENKRIIDYPAETLMRLAGKLLDRAEARTGRKESDDLQHAALVNEIYSDFKKFQALTVLEIKAALEKGLDGDYSTDGVIVFSPANLVYWVKQYIEGKKKAIAKYQRLLSQVKDEPKEPTFEQTLNLRMAILVDALQDTVEGKSYEDFTGTLYNFLESLEFLKLTDSQKWDYFDRAKLVLISEAQNSTEKGLFKSIRETIDSANKTGKSDKISGIAKRIAVKDKLKSICENGADDANDFLELVKEKVKELISQNKSENHVS